MSATPNSVSLSLSICSFACPPPSGLGLAGRCVYLRLNRLLLLKDWLLCLPPFLSCFVASNSENFASSASFLRALRSDFPPWPPPFQSRMSWSSPPTAITGRNTFASLSDFLAFLCLPRSEPVFSRRLSADSLSVVFNLFAEAFASVSEERHSSRRA
jgi:hypothetical protein